MISPKRPPLSPPITTLFTWSIIITIIITTIITPNQPPYHCTALSTPTDPPTTTTNRRDLLTQSTIAAAIATTFPQPAQSSQPQPRPIAVLGANGRTGTLCVSACLRQNIPVRALTRSGDWKAPSDDAAAAAAAAMGDGLYVGTCDLRDTSSVAKAVEGCRGVVYAASASKNGGSPQEIDNEGVVAAANACITAGVPRYVVISSTATTRPKSLGYVFTNVFSSGGIMDQKRKGEVGVQLAYTDASPGLSYTIIRPGGLEEPKRNEVLGPGALEFSQGDVLAGIISRADLAEATIAATVSDVMNVRDASFEVYYTDSVQPCEGRFKALVGNGGVPRIHGREYETLFGGLKPDGGYYVPE